MKKSWLARLAGVAAVAVIWAGSSSAAEPPLPRYSYYPYYYFPHSYWPTLSPQWPEPPGHTYVRPPAYMAYPPFKEPNVESITSAATTPAPAPPKIRSAASRATNSDAAISSSLRT